MATLFGLGYRTLQRWVAPLGHARHVLARDEDRALRPVGKNAIKACGATMQFLPPYSYDFNPIEAAWA